MEKSRRISQYRERLDKTLASADLKDPNMLETLVRNQLQQTSISETEGCSEHVIAKRTSEVSRSIDLLRSASVTNNGPYRSGETSHAEWKLKDDNEEYRVMYRPGPEGSPFHSLLAEGYVDGPIDACLCISLESTLYRKWWPQFSFPPFRITHSECLKRVRLGEQICLIRVKVPWPMSSREAVVHYFVFEYLQDDLIIILCNTIPDIEDVNKSTHGFTKDGIPEAKEVVRIDLVGAFAIQKVTAERSYFRSIASMDMKLNIVPPALINFVSRQLIGSGFRLYQKTVTSLSNFDQDYSKVLEEDPMYARIRGGSYSTPEPDEEVGVKDMNGPHTYLLQRGEFQLDACLEAEERSTPVMLRNSGDMGSKNVDASETSLEKARPEERKAYGEIEEEDSGANGHSKPEISHGSDPVSKVLQNDFPQTDENTPGKIDKEDTPREIEEEDNESGRPLKEVYETKGQASAHITDQKNNANYRRNVTLVRPEVKQALETLDKVISLVRGRELQLVAPEVPSASGREEINHGEKDSLLSEEREVCLEAEVASEALGDDKIPNRSSNESKRSSGSRGIRRAGSSSSTREMNHNKIAPASPEQHQSPPNGSNQAPASQHIKPTSTAANGVHSESLHAGKELRRRRKYGVCCFVPAPHE